MCRVVPHDGVSRGIIIHKPFAKVELSLYNDGNELKLTNICDQESNQTHT